MKRKTKVKKRAMLLCVAALLLSQTLVSYATGDSANSLSGNRKPATEHTAAINNAVYDLLDFDDMHDFDNATRGFIAAPDGLEISDANGNIVWSQDAYSFVHDEAAPDTANPSLWRNTQLNHIYGLFEVTEGIYQVRGYDVTNLTLVEGDTGWIVLDPMTNVETSAAAMQLVNETLGEKPIMAIIYSHPHGDHFGGVKGIISDEEVIERGIPVIVPDGFEANAISEYVYAGNAMGRRADYMYGFTIEPDPQGRLSTGLAITLPQGYSSYIKPNDIIYETGEIRIIDGVTMEFQMTPGTEAPAEMNTWFPGFKALWMAENCNHTLHNMYTLRGAQVRDGNAWAKYIMEAVERYTGEAEVMFTAHNWPRWGNEALIEYFIEHSAIYKFINDQTLMYINQGYVDNEIAHMIKLPDDLEAVWHTRPYYGTVQHNSKAVYQKYMGWYTANPVFLHALPLSESAKKLAEYLGDASEVLKKAREDFDKGEYQWVAEITNVLLHADPGNDEARYLLADALEQLGYQAESGPWRHAYLTGAKELREGMEADSAVMRGGSGDLLRSMQPNMIFDYLGIRIDSNAAQDINMTINVVFLGDESYVLTVKSGVVLYRQGGPAQNADVTITVPREAAVALLSVDGLSSEYVSIEGDRDALLALYGYMVAFSPVFGIIEP